MEVCFRLVTDIILNRNLLGLRTKLVKVTCADTLLRMAMFVISQQQKTYSIYFAISVEFSSQCSVDLLNT